jgi:hypothetical protein
VKRTHLKRKTSLKRQRPVVPRAKTKYRARPRDLEYMAWVRRQPCCAAFPGRVQADPPVRDCYGPIEADHAGLRSVGRKADDRTCIPLCRHHHRCRGSFSGVFRTWTKAQMRVWLDAMVRWYQIRWRQEHV